MLAASPMALKGSILAHNKCTYSAKSSCGASSGPLAAMVKIREFERALEELNGGAVREFSTCVPAF